MNDFEWARAQRKCELHRHLEGAIPFSTLMKLQTDGIITDQNWTSEEQCKSSIVFHEPADDLDAVLAHFDLFQRCFVSIDAVKLITRDVILQAINTENINLLELRFSPLFIAETHKLDVKETIQAVIAGKQLAIAQCPPDTIVGLIMIHSRNHGQDTAVRIAQFATMFKNDIVAFDLAGPESGFPPEMHIEAAKILHNAGIPLTVHCGEGTPPELIERTLNSLRPRRLGHAISLVMDDKLVQRCRDEGICVEACPTSNLITNGVASYSQHPVRELLAAGVPVSISSDDPTLWCDLSEEWVHCLRDIGMSRDELLAMDRVGRSKSFCVGVVPL